MFGALVFTMAISSPAVCDLHLVFGQGMVLSVVIDYILKCSDWLVIKSDASFVQYLMKRISTNKHRDYLRTVVTF